MDLMDDDINAVEITVASNLGQRPSPEDEKVQFEMHEAAMEHMQSLDDLDAERLRIEEISKEEEARREEDLREEARELEEQERINPNSEVEQFYTVSARADEQFDKTELAARETTEVAQTAAKEARQMEVSKTREPKIER